MARVLAARMTDGALAVFYVPRWRPGRDGVDEAWNKCAWVIETATGVRLRPLIGRDGLHAAAAPDCPPVIAGLLARARPSYELHVRVDEFGASVDHRVVGAIESPTGIPCAIAGFPGQGAWLILPGDEGAHAVRACGVAVGLLDVLDGMRPRASTTAASERPRHQARPRTGTGLHGVLRALEAASAGEFVVVRDRRAIARLKDKYGFPIESVADARARVANVSPTAKGYRLVPRDGR
jgi:hypothetical protein